ncbi:hypothetical protein [Hydrogenophilus thiooxidans]|uniref:hypothetical protein n=1 Tax=Hydrogenophilus thiooxidans TaxID=2820326 RepID=UPI001C2181CA|nr:hypothetical protein [Hydrogenophilus thiooxidans]
MDMMQHLSARLHEIERQHFGVTIGLIQAVERGELPDEIARAVRASEAWRQYQELVAQEDDALTAPVAEPGDAIPMPAALRELIARRVAANRQHGTEPIGRPGQIVCVERITLPEGAEPMPGVMTAPLYVLLDAPDEEMATFWHGWIAAGEVEFAGPWDHVIQEEEGAVDPEAAMVQVWNPVRLYLPMATRVVGRVAKDRLDAIRSLAADFLTDTLPDYLPVAIGKIAVRETSTGHWVVTGGNLGGNGDPRHRYQQLYLDAADAIREAALAAVRALATQTHVAPANDTPRTTWWEQGERLWERLVAALGDAFTWQPQIAVAMSGDAAQTAQAVPENACALNWRNLAHIVYQSDPRSPEGLLAVRNGAERPLSVELRDADGNLLEVAEIAPGEAETFGWDERYATLTLSVDGLADTIPLGEALRKRMDG